MNNADSDDNNEQNSQNGNNLKIFLKLRNPLKKKESPNLNKITNDKMINSLIQEKKENFQITEMNPNKLSVFLILFMFEL